MSGGGRAGAVANRYPPLSENAGRSSQSIIVPNKIWAPKSLIDHYKNSNLA
jgi:hypothetical protein